MDRVNCSVTINLTIRDTSISALTGKLDELVTKVEADVNEIGVNDFVVEPRTVKVCCVDIPDRNRKLEAIKNVREITGMGLKEAKDFVEGKVIPVGPSENWITTLRLMGFKLEPR